MDKRSKLYLAIVFSFSFMILEVVGGILANSLAILSDAVHLFSDITGFVIALIAVELATLPVTSSFTYGHGRAEIIGAFISVLSLWFATFYLMLSAMYRILLWLGGKGEAVNGKYMFIVACIGVVVNLCLAAIFHEEHHAASAFSVHGHNCSDESCVRNLPTGDVKFVGIESNGIVNSELCGVCDQLRSPRVTKAAWKKRRTKQYGGVSYGLVGVDMDSELLEAGELCAEDEEETIDLSQTGGDGYDSSVGGGFVGKMVDWVQHSVSAVGTSLDSYTSSPQATGEDLNMRAVYLHILTDMAQSMGVAVVGGIIWANPSLYLLDPVSSLLFGILIVW
jgi:cation diffusion facilitator family transporter